VSAEEWTTFQSNNENNGVYSGELTTDFTDTNWMANYTPGGWACWDSAPVIGNGTVYAVKNNGHIVALNLTTGNEIWYNDAIGGNGFFELCTPAYDPAGDRLFVGLSAGNQTIDTGIHCLNAATGGSIWDNSSDIYPANHQLLSGIKYDSETGYIYFGTYGSNGLFYCVNGTTGICKWHNTSTSNGYYWATPAIIGDYVVVGNEAGYVYCFNKTTGDTVDSYYFGVSAPIRSGITYDSSTQTILYTIKTGGSPGGYLVSIGFNPTTGAIDESDVYSVTGLTASLTTTPTVAGGRVFVSSNAYVYSYTVPTLGNKKVSGSMGGDIKASPVVSTADADMYYVYVTTNSGSAKCCCIPFDTLDESFGTAVLWEPTDTDYTLQGIAAADGWLVFGNDAGHIYGMYNSTI
jgi:outer membrane protein assembly factor BamB